MNRLTFEERKKANKIRCKLLNIIDKDIRENKKKKENHMLINSMSLKEIEDKFLLFPNYKMKLSTTFTKNANIYVVVEIVDNKLKQNFYYTDYSQDQQETNQSIVKKERKRISCNDIIKIKYFREEQELQSPLPELFTNKMNIGDKKLIKQKNKEIFSDKKKLGFNKGYTMKEFDSNNNLNICNSKLKNKNINLNDDDFFNSLTFELIQKKANMFSAIINKKNKNELKRRKNQLEAIKKLRQFCFQKLRNKRTCKTKSSQRNLLYINTKFEEEDEKNNTSYSSKKLKNNTKNNRKLSKMKNSKNNSKKKYDGLKEPKKRKCTFKKTKEKKKNENNSIARKMFRNNSAKKSPLKSKRNQRERKSLVLTNTIISGNIENDILRFKKYKKEKNESGENIKQENKLDEEIVRKSHANEKMKTGILRDSFREKLFIKNQFIFNKKFKRKYGTVIFNEVPTTKRISSDNNFFNRKQRTKQTNIHSSTNLVKPIKFQIKRKASECMSESNQRYSTPKDEKSNKKDKNSEKSFNKNNHKKTNEDSIKNWLKTDKKEKNNIHKKKKSSIYKEKNKIHNIMQKVEEVED